MKRGIFLVAAVPVAAGLVVVGRAERRHDYRVRNAEIARIRAVAESGAAGLPTAYRTTPGFGCLIYGTKKKPFGIELCYDPAGRIVEAIDRRAAPIVHIATLRFVPSAATNRGNTNAILAILKQRQPKRYASFASLPLGGDEGPQPFPTKP